MLIIFIKKSEKDFFKKLGKSNGWNELNKVIDYEQLKVRHKHPIYKSKSKKIGRCVLSKSTFENNTNNLLNNTLKMEGKTESCCQIEIKEGYIASGKADVSFQIEFPLFTPELNIGLRQEYNFDNYTKKRIVEEINWAIESTVQVPKMTTITAELVVEKNKYEKEFEIKTYFSGTIFMKLLKGNIELHKFELSDLRAFLTPDKGFKEEENGEISILTKGICNANFGVKQRIELKQSNINSN